MIKRGLFFAAFVCLFVCNTTQLSGQNNKSDAMNWFRRNSESLKISEEDIADLRVNNEYTDKVTGITYQYVKQHFKGIPVYNAISVAVLKNSELVHVTPGLINSVSAKANSNIPVITAQSSIDFAAKHIGKNNVGSIQFLSSNRENSKYAFSAPDLSAREILVDLVWVSVGDKVKLAWNVSVELRGEAHWWNVRVDAATGEYLEKNDYVAECNFDHGNVSNVNNYSHCNHTSNHDGIESLLAPDAPDYRVFALPLEAPTFGSRTLLNNPGLSLASPFGWHDVNGASGADFTITRGNNVFAYEDANNDNLPGYSPNGTSNLVFDYPFTPNATPITNQDASITNLFYMNNIIHDYLYPVGFTEAAGNFQQNNYGNGGQGNDHVLAEAFDGGGTNNANFATPPDGSSGRMQMYLWSGNVLSCTNLTISSSSFNGSMSVGTASFTGIGTATGQVLLVNDGSTAGTGGTVTDGCQTIITNLTGKIALIDRGGGCNLTTKVQNAVAKGAVGVIIANNVSGPANNMAGTPQQSVPVVSVSQADGVILKNAITNGTTNATINTCVANQIDGSFDNGIIAHEYGHGVSNRLTGGPAEAGCVGTNNETGSEGWSDWLALVLTIEPGDAGANARGIGSFAIAQPTNGGGIRRQPYSTNMSINNQTYATLASSSGVHQVGEIWCSAIWDMTWFLIEDLGFDSNPLNLNSGNAIAMRLVLEGMKLQPCQPGFIDARNAILLADQILYNNAHRCRIWEAFARRGMGYLAAQGNKNVLGDETVNFSMPYFCSPPNLPPVANFSATPVNPTCGQTVTFTDNSSEAYNWFWDFGDQTYSNFQNPTKVYNTAGQYTVKLVVTNPLGSDSLIQTNYITVGASFTADITATPATICQGESSQLEVIPSAPPAPTYCAATHSNGCAGGDEYIANVTFGSINNSTTCAQTSANRYSNFTNLSTTVAINSSTPISVSNPNVFAGDQCRVWVDWNQNGSFNDPGEETILTGTSLFTGNVVAPANAVNGATRMRVRLTYTDGMASCGVAAWGETEDYTVIVSNGGSPYSFSWSPSNTLSSATISNPVAQNVISTQNYSVLVTNTAGCGLTKNVTLNVTPAPVYYQDIDNDGFGYPNATLAACTQPEGYVANNSDCNDNNSNVKPGATETCNGIDDNCNGNIDEGLVFNTYYQDSDGDGYGSIPIGNFCQVPGNCYGDYTFNFFSWGNLNESGWAIKDASNSIVASGFGYTFGSFNSFNLTLNNGPFTVEIYTGCNFANNNPYFQLYNNGNLLADGATAGCNAFYSTGNICGGNGSSYTAQGGDCHDGNANINPAITEVCGNGIDDDCDGLVDEGCTRVQNSQCGQTLPDKTTAVLAISIPGVSVYRFKIQWNGNTVIVDRPVRWFRFTDHVLGYSEATTYQVSVSTSFGGGAFGGYGQVCNVTVPHPTTKIQASQCGGTLISIGDNVIADLVTNATSYKFKISNGGVDQILVKNVRFFKFTELPSWSYGNTYQVSVSVEMNNTFGPFGIVCNITTPAPGTPTTTLDAAACGIVLSSLTTNLNAITVPQATEYEFLVENSTLGYSQSIVRTLRWFRMSMMPPSIIPGTTYTVKVRAKTGGIWGPYGTLCNVTTPNVPPSANPNGNNNNSTEEEMETEAISGFDAVAFPNPFTDAFTLNIRSQSNDAVVVRVYDLNGKMLENRNLQASEAATVVIGGNLAAGMYHVTVMQGDNVKTMKMIKTIR